MDLRSIMNAEATGPPHQRSPSSPRRPSEYGQEPIHGHGGGYEQSPPDHARARPPQPPPLQPPHHPPRAESLSSQGFVQSPYQQSPASTLSSGGSHPQRSQTLPHAFHGVPPTSQHESFSPPTTVDNRASYPQPAGSAHPHFTAQQQPPSGGASQSYGSRPRSHSSVHSATTPSSAHSYSFHPPPPLPPPQSSSQPGPRDSVAGTYQAGVPQPQSYSPTYQRSQPGTPQEHPSNSYPHPSPHSARPPSSGHDAQASALGSPWASQQDARRRDQGPAISPAAETSLSRQNTGTSPYFPGRRPSGQHQTREATMSVSPKTAATGLGSQGDTSKVGVPSTVHADVGETSWQTTNNTSATNAPSHPHDLGLPSQQQSFHRPTTPKTSVPHSITPRNSTSSPLSKQSSIKDTSPAPMSAPPPPPSGTTGNAPVNLPLEPTTAQPKKKRKRYNEPPIFAQKAPRTSGKPPAIPHRQFTSPSRRSLPAKPPQKPDNADSQAPSKSRPSTPRSGVSVRADTNGQVVNGTGAELPPDNKDPQLRPWEPSITGLIPHEELTKVVCDFLFEHVVMRKDIDAGSPGGASASAGAILEVEAKLGKLVDKHRGDRLRIPVVTESVLSKEDPGLRIAFESSMSLDQHRALNNFLNDSVKATLAPGGQRVPISYSHKKEQDSFYEIAPAALPPVVQHYLNPRHKPKVRVTTDQRTGAVLARIIKCRIADMDVYSPRTCLDWRISVNLEMNYDGDVRELVPASDGGRGGDRNKDRMSYRHLAYQVDLTQVADSEAPQSGFEHELEVEISSADVRRQGDLALAGDLNNQYEELVKGFVDNIRVLARAVPS